MIWNLDMLEPNVVIIGILPFLCIVWVIYDVLVNNKKAKPSMKILWIALALLFSVITAIVYYFVVKKK